MKKFDLSEMGVKKLNSQEMVVTYGGFIWFVIAAGVLLLSSCQSQVNNQIGGSHNTINNAEQSADSTLNGNSVPIGY